MVRVLCDKCGKMFEIKNRVRSHGLDIEETYFWCTHCKTKYFCFVTDSECRKLQREIREIMKSKEVPASKFANKRINEVEYAEEINRIDQKIEKKQIELKMRMNKLKREDVEEYVIGPHGESARLYLYDGDQEGTHSYIEIDGPARIIINKD